MWQYPRLYGCRISGKEVDTFEYRELPDARHIIIMRKGIVSMIQKIFIVEVSGQCDTIYYSILFYVAI